MKIASGLLLGVWLLFLWYRLAITPPAGGEGERIQIITAFVLSVQTVGWAFSFTQPLFTLAVLLFTGCLTTLLALMFSPVYWLLAVTTLVLVGVCALGVRGSKKKG